MSKLIAQSGPETARAGQVSPELINLGLVLGQRGALAAVGGRCSAAHAQVLRRIRNEKLYLPLAPCWRQFCQSHLRLSRRHADRLIALLNQFGPAYFELSQLIGISPQQFAVIQSAVHEDCLLVDGDSISLIPQNSARIAKAVDALIMQRASSRPSPPLHARIDNLAARGRALANQFLSLYSSAISGDDRERILEAATEIRVILLQLGIDSPLRRRGA